ncbi:MAG: NADH-quinone oxidoreductase subunit G [Alphaproteobacteria bacterium]|nr:MAG: NADH-quinone oxidoreductase subunit G [Alphaproteobacteria bacterium]TAF14675.1 MAG: NADH-quinone oxidoreductase subunit G [Alphaproteobacteria bacterium]TAF41258.1 MAG: NADH-quinone oxidoreductase subunit G [Alphaproteobacteria bacterium]TAF75771.1 MAG: NADH-quinone oxidoreductase subunit G [Alphaproteobacteria bacterium]
MPIININGNDYEFDNGLTLIQACEQVGVEIPRFCYHEKLEIAGNCRMCLVEAVGMPKPVASCAMGVNDLRPDRDGNPPKIRTDSELVKKAREGVMEFLLINHPLDCPICDQGGECDLQDQALYYGKGVSRYEHHKRAVEDKYMGPLIKTHMTRCIHCTRCVRFMEDVAGVPELGATGRGEGAEITTYIEQALHSELSGNIVDLCPVGALTSRPYAFAARPWELKKVETIDVMDAVGSNIRVDVRGNAVLRVLPRLHEDVNEEWISDKTRHACDGLKIQRLDRPYLRENGALRPASWDEAFAAIAEAVRPLKGNQIAALAGNLVSTEAMFALKELMHNLGSVHYDCRQEGAYIPTASRHDYLFNTTIAGIDRADVIVLVGTNPRLEAALVNARIRKRYLAGGLRVVNIGNPHDLTYPVEELGTNPQILADILSGKHPIAEVIRAAKNPMIVVGMAALSRADGDALYRHARAIADAMMVRDEWNGFNILHNSAARVGGLDVGFVPGVQGMGTATIMDAAESGAIKLVYLLGVDEIDMSCFAPAFVVYQGHHGDAGAAYANVVLPGAAYTEQDGIYVNLEGRVQYAVRAVFPPNEAKEDWRIIRALSEIVGHSLPYQSLNDVREAMLRAHPQLQHEDRVQIHAPIAMTKASLGAIHSVPFAEAITNFYMTDPISRVSKTMAACTREVGTSQNKVA